MSFSNPHPESTLSRCSTGPLSGTIWEYDHDSMMLSSPPVIPQSGWLGTRLLSRMIGSVCVVRDGDAASTQNCNMGYTKLLLVVHTRHRAKNNGVGNGKIESLVAETNAVRAAHSKTRRPIENGEWICERTGLRFPRNLDEHLPSTTTSVNNPNEHIRDDRQVLMGADVYTKVSVCEHACDFVSACVYL